MKITLHVPTEQFGFAELEQEINLDTPSADIRATYDRLKDAFAAKEGITDKEMDTFVENQLLEKGNDVNLYEAMTAAQQKEVQRIKRAIKRIGSKE